MLKGIQKLFKGRVALLISVIITVIIAYLSLAKVKAPIVTINNFDKVQHCIAYFVLSFAWLVALAKNTYMKVIIVSVCILYGILIEYLQSTMTNYRFAEFADAVANTVGVLLALLVFTLIKKR